MANESGDAVALTRWHTFARALLLLSGAAFHSAAHAQATVSPELQRLVDAEKWQLDLQITFDASTSSSWAKTGTANAGSEQSTLHAEYQESIPLLLHSPGPSLSMQKFTNFSRSDPAAAAQAQKGMMDLVMQGDKIGSWMIGAPETPDSDDIAKSLAAAAAIINMPVGSMKFDFKSRVYGEDLHNEVGDNFNKEVVVTSRGEAGVVRGTQQITFELNAASKRVLLTVPAILAPKEENVFKRETLVTYIPLPLGPRPTQEASTRGEATSIPRQVKTTDPALTFGNGILLFDDPLVVAGGKISGHHTLTATYEPVHMNGSPIPGKLVVNYTLTPH
jgi:hypothetical protein